MKWRGNIVDSFENVLDRNTFIYVPIHMGNIMLIYHMCDLIVDVRSSVSVQHDDVLYLQNDFVSDLRLLWAFYLGMFAPNYLYMGIGWLIFMALQGAPLFYGRL